MPLSSVEEAIQDLKAGKFLIVVDDERRENEGDLVMPAEKVTAESVNFMVTHAMNDVAGFTGTLKVIYRSPTPLGEPLTMRAWLDRCEGRKSFVKGVLMHGATLCAEAEGIFVSAADGSTGRRKP